jgi:hypothetical protein
VEKFFPWRERAAVKSWETLPLENDSVAVPLLKSWSKIAEFCFFGDWVPVEQIRLEKTCTGAAIRIVRSYHLFLPCLPVSSRSGGLTVDGLLLSSRCFFHGLSCWKLTKMPSTRGVSPEIMMLGKNALFAASTGSLGCSLVAFFIFGDLLLIGEVSSWNIDGALPPGPAFVVSLKICTFCAVVGFGSCKTFAAAQIVRSQKPKRIAGASGIGQRFLRVPFLGESICKYILVRALFSVWGASRQSEGFH